MKNKKPIFEKNVPTDPEKWSYAKAQAKKKFDVYPSAYANGWAAKKYKELGGSWKKEESIEKENNTMTKLKSLMPESVSDIKQYRNKESDPWNDSMIRLILMRKVEGKTAVYRLETDNWFRRFENPGKGYGVMIRGIKISQTPVKVTSSWAIGPHHVVLNAIVKYLPNEFVDMDDDVESNYETTKGFIILGTKNLPGFEMMQTLKPKDIEHFIKVNIPNYKP